MIKKILPYIEFIILFLPLFLPFVSLNWLESKETICVFSNLTGIDCFGCGITKSLIAILKLEFTKAFQYNKLVIIIAPLLFFVWIKRWVHFINIRKLKQF